MQYGLYKIGFKTVMGEGTGAVSLLPNGILIGGDSVIAYVGKYRLEGDSFTAEVTTCRHSPGLLPVFDQDDVKLKIDGTFTGDTAVLSAITTQAPGTTLLGFLRLIKAI